MKNLYSLILLIFISVSFVACGGGGGSSFTQEKVDITVACLPTTPPLTGAQIATYQELYSGDKIVKIDALTVVQIYTLVGQNSRVCLESGSAEIIRK